MKLNEETFEQIYEQGNKQQLNEDQWYPFYDKQDYKRAVNGDDLDPIDKEAAGEVAYLYLQGEISQEEFHKQIAEIYGSY